MWLSSYIGLIANRKRLLTPGPVYGYFSLEPRDTQWLKHERNHRLSDTNKVIDKDYRCIKGVRDTLGDWTSVLGKNERE